MPDDTLRAALEALCDRVDDHPGATVFVHTLRTLLALHPADAAPAQRDTEGALEVLAQLSERSNDGRLRDSIAAVRTALWDELDA